MLLLWEATYSFGGRLLLKEVSHEWWVLKFLADLLPVSTLLPGPLRHEQGPLTLFLSSSHSQQWVEKLRWLVPESREAAIHTCLALGFLKKGNAFLLFIMPPWYSPGASWKNMTGVKAHGVTAFIPWCNRRAYFLGFLWFPQKCLVVWFSLLKLHRLCLHYLNFSKVISDHLLKIKLQ